MKSAYERYRERAEKHRQDLAPVVAETLRLAKGDVFPQHILWDKEVCSDLEGGKAKTVRKDGSFYFTEELVNRLMLFAYLRGSRDIDMNSYKRGWTDCRADVAEKLGFEEEL